MTVPVPGGGRVVAITFSIAASNGFGNRSRFLCKVFRHLGLGTGPCPP